MKNIKKPGKPIGFIEDQDSDYKITIGAGYHNAPEGSIAYLTKSNTIIEHFLTTDEIAEKANELKIINFGLSCPEVVLAQQIRAKALKLNYEEQKAKQR